MLVSFVLHGPVRQQCGNVSLKWCQLGSSIDRNEHSFDRRFVHPISIDQESIYWIQE